MRKKSQKNNFPIFITILFALIAAFFIMPTSQDKLVYAANWKNQSNDYSFTNVGTGSTTSPYQISSASQLATVARKISTYKSKSFILVENIDVSAYSWTPIGTSTHNYTGNFDGNNLTISGLYIARGDKVTYSGLFGYVSNAQIKNLTLGPSTKQVCGNNSIGAYTGALAGIIDDTEILNCTNSGVNVYSMASSTTYAGGLVGYASGTSKIQNSFNHAKVLAHVATSSYAYAGGIVGRVYSGSTLTALSNGGAITALSNNASSYTYAGGLFGRAASKITDSYNLGKVISGTSSASNVKIDGGTYYTTSNTKSYAGGIAGYSVEIEDCFNRGNITSRAKEAETAFTHSAGTSSVNHSLGGAGSSQARGSFSANLTVYNYDYTLTYDPGDKDPPDYSKSQKVEGAYKKTLAYSGGIVGYSTSSIRDCYNTGTITGGSKIKTQTDAFTFSFSSSSSAAGFGSSSNGSFLVYYVYSEHVDTSYFSAINGNRSKTLTNSYATSKNINKTRKIKVTSYEEGLTKKTKTTSTITDSTGSYTPSISKIGNSSYTWVDNIKFQFDQTDTTSTLSVKYRGHKLVSATQANPNPAPQYLNQTYTIFTKTSSQEVKYTQKSASSITASNLGTGDWKSDPDINNGLPILKNLYW